MSLLEGITSPEATGQNPDATDNEINSCREPLMTIPPAMREMRPMVLKVTIKKIFSRHSSGNLGLRGNGRGKYKVEY